VLFPFLVYSDHNYINKYIIMAGRRKLSDEPTDIIVNSSGVLLVHNNGDI